MSADFLKRLSNLLGCAFLICAILGIWFTGMRSVETEAGLVEIMSSLTLFVAVVVFALASGPDTLGRYWFGTVILVFLCARELDVDKRLFEHGLLSLKHYTGAAPLWQKGIGALIAAGLIAALVMLGRRGLPRLVAGLRDRRTWAVLIAVALGLVVVGKGLDGFERKFPGLVQMLPAGTVQHALFWEEVFELAAALCLLLAVPRLPVGRQAAYHEQRDGHHEMS